MKPNSLRQSLKSKLIGLALPLLLASSFSTVADTKTTDSWHDIEAQAKGQTVYFNAWGGSDRINDYLSWVAERVEDEYGVKLVHVKIGDIAEVVSQLEAAKAVGRNEKGNVDLIWVNGENFAALKRNDLLFGSFADSLPNAASLKDSASVTTDFSIPVAGLESPWGGAQLVFIYDTYSMKSPPLSAIELLEFVNDGGRFAYPAPPAFHGTTMVKQFLLELTESPEALTKAVDESDFDSVTAPLWAYLDKLHPNLWGKGKSWPSSAETTRQMLDDGELDIAISFNPFEASAAVKNDQLPDTVRTYVFTEGTIGNTHFVTIPYNATAKAGAMIVADFLISPEAQARKADPNYWGDPTVLDLNALNSSDAALFDAIDAGPWSLPIGIGRTIAEPHASWAKALEDAWLKRYGN